MKLLPKIVAAGMVLSVGFLSACAAREPGPEDGTYKINQMRMTEAYEETYSQMIGDIPVPMTREVPAQYYVWVKNGLGSHKLRVPEAFYQRLENNREVCITNEVISSLSSCD